MRKVCQRNRVGSLHYIYRRDKNLIYGVSPTLKLYLESSSLNTTYDPKHSKVEITEIGKEEVAGHDCVKRKIVFIQGAIAKTEAFTWEAIELKRVPIQIEITTMGTTCTTLLKDIQFEEPAATLFEPPNKCQKCKSKEEFDLTLLGRWIGLGLRKMLTAD